MGKFHGKFKRCENIRRKFKGYEISSIPRCRPGSNSIHVLAKKINIFRKTLQLGKKDRSPKEGHRTSYWYSGRHGANMHHTNIKCILETQ